VLPLCGEALGEAFIVGRMDPAFAATLDACLLVQPGGSTRDESVQVSD
jgi:hypothetical protein